MKWLLMAMLVLVTPAAAPALAQGVSSLGPETGRPLPRYASLRFDKVRMRRGAGENYPIAWVYQRRGLPVQIFQEFENWRHVRDVEGTTGWMHRTQLTSTPTGIVIGATTPLRDGASESAALLAQAEPGVVLTLTACEIDWCDARVGGYRGWVQKSSLWGISPDRVFED